MAFDLFSKYDEHTNVQGFKIPRMYNDDVTWIAWNIIMNGDLPPLSFTYKKNHIERRWWHLVVKFPKRLRLGDSFFHDFFDSVIPIFCFPQEKIRVALYVQKAALQFIEGMKF